MEFTLILAPYRFRKITLPDLRIFKTPTGWFYTIGLTGTSPATGPFETHEEALVDAYG